MTTPRVWLLIGKKAGDNTQLRALAQALGWPTIEKRCRYRATELLTNRLLGTTLAGMDRRRSDPLEPEWPDLLLTAGRRNEPIARWVSRQSGGRTRIVHVGRPWSSPDRFDLVISTPQYDLPPSQKVLVIDMPLHAVRWEALEEAARSWRAEFHGLPHPRIAVLVGGPTGFIGFREATVARLAREAETLARWRGGSLLVTTSARTPAFAADLLRRALEVPARIYPHGGEKNPYLAFLALADEFIVTGESASMLAEAAATGKPLHVFDPTGEDGLLGRFRPRALGRLARELLGPRRMKRDPLGIPRALVEQGRACWLGEAPPSGERRLGTNDDLERAAVAVRALFPGAQDRGEDVTRRQRRP